MSKLKINLLNRLKKPSYLKRKKDKVVRKIKDKFGEVTQVFVSSYQIGESLAYSKFKKKPKEKHYDHKGFEEHNDN